MICTHFQRLSTKSVARAIVASALYLQIGFGPAVFAQTVPLNYTNDLPIMSVAASEVCSGITYYDITGNVQTGTKSCGPPADCTSNGAVGCVTTASYKSADFTTILASNIKRGVGIGGVTGNYPSATSPLSRYSDNGSTTATTGSDETDLTNFATQVTSSGTFEYWDSSGIRRTGSGDADIVAGNIKNAVAFENLSLTGTYAGAAVTPPNAWDLRAGSVFGGVTGKLKVNCRNAVRLSGTRSFNNTTAPASSSTTAGDIWDTIDDYYGLPASTVFPSSWSVANNYCGGVDDPNLSSDDDNVWKDVTTTNGTTASTCEATPDNCTMQDKISGLKWSKFAPSRATWQTAITTCNGLTHNGQTAGSWRLPTQKELMDAYNHGITSAARTDANWMTQLNMGSNYFWSSSSNLSGGGPTYASLFRLGSGSSVSQLKTSNGGKDDNHMVVCVQDSVTKPLISLVATKYALAPNQAMAVITPTLMSGTLTGCTMSPALPAGLSIDAATCVISGTPTSSSAATTYTITATKPEQVQTQGLTIEVANWGDVTEDNGVWKDVTTTNGTTASTCATTPGNCTMQDKISGLKWSKFAPSRATWQTAITTCNGLTHNGQTAGSWRLPTQKELMDAYNHGITSAARTDANWMTQLNMGSNYFWSSSSNLSGGGPTYASLFRLGSGSSVSQLKTSNGGKDDNHMVVCVQ